MARPGSAPVRPGHAPHLWRKVRGRKCRQAPPDLDQHGLCRPRRSDLEPGRLRLRFEVPRSDARAAQSDRVAIRQSVRSPSGERIPKVVQALRLPRLGSLPA
eukprot:12291182-Heterocapsa_arctica.AAC.1